MSDSEDRELIVRRAMFGKQVDIFMSSDIGKYLLARAKDESDQAFEAFKKCDSSNSVEVLRIQNIITQSDKFKSWLDEAVTDGLQALDILEDRTDHE